MIYRRPGRALFTFIPPDKMDASKCTHIVDALSLYTARLFSYTVWWGKRTKHRRCPDADLGADHVAYIREVIKCTRNRVHLDGNSKTVFEIEILSSRSTTVKPFFQFVSPKITGRHIRTIIRLGDDGKGEKTVLTLSTRITDGEVLRCRYEIPDVVDGLKLAIHEPFRRGHR